MSFTRGGPQRQDLNSNVPIQILMITASKIRVILRWAHIVLGLEILCYIYSPFSKFFWFKAITQFVVVPLIVFSGIWIWKFNQFNKFFGIK